MLASSPGGLAPSPKGNPGSAPVNGFTLTTNDYHICDLKIGNIMSEPHVKFSLYEPVS